MQKNLTLIVLTTSIGCHRPTVRKNLEFIEPLSSPLLTLDPSCAYDTDSMQVLREVFEPLFKINSKGEVLPELVEKYSISKHQKVFTLTLKPKIFFHNKKELTSKDLKWTIERNLNIPTHSDKTKNIFKCLIRIDTPSKYNIKFVFNQPKPFFISQLTTLSSAPMAKDSAPLDQQITQPQQMVGTGPYRIHQHIPNSQITLRSFDQYHGEQPNIRFIKRPLIPDHQAKLNFFIKKKADKITLNRSMIDTVKSNKELLRCCKIIPRLSTTYLAIGLNSHPCLQDKEVRKALLSWIPINTLEKELTLNTASLAKNFVPYKIPDYNYSKKYFINHNQVLKELLQKKSHSSQNPLQLKIYYRADNSNHQRTAEILARAWNRCPGLKIKLNPCQRYKIHSAQETQKMNFFITRWLADYPDPQHGLECFTKNNPQNYSGFNNDFYDTLLNQATKTRNKKRRYQICEKAEKYILDQAVILPLTYDSEIELIQKYITGFETNPIFDLSYKTLSFLRGSHAHQN